MKISSALLFLVFSLPHDPLTPLDPNERPNPLTICKLQLELYNSARAITSLQRFYYKTWIMTLKVIYMLLLEKVVAPKESAGGVVCHCHSYYIGSLLSFFTDRTQTPIM